MSDRELLVLAAKAAGYTVSPGGRTDGAFIVLRNEHGDFIWNPLTDDGDALRMATKLRITINQDWKTKVQVEWRDGYTPLYYYIDCTDTDRAAATRRAIVRAAAEIGGRTP